MDAGSWFWIIYVIAILFGGGFSFMGRPADPSSQWMYRGWVGATGVLFILVGILGYRVFQGPIH